MTENCRRFAEYLRMQALMIVSDGSSMLKNARIRSLLIFFTLLVATPFGVDMVASPHPPL
jgi:hypothetical protein